MVVSFYKKNTKYFVFKYLGPAGIVLKYYLNFYVLSLIQNICLYRLSNELSVSCFV